MIANKQTCLEVPATSPLRHWAWSPDRRGTCLQTRYLLCRLALAAAERAPKQLCIDTMLRIRYIQQRQHNLLHVRELLHRALVCLSRTSTGATQSIAYNSSRYYTQKHGAHASTASPTCRSTSSSLLGRHPRRPSKSSSLRGIALSLAPLPDGFTVWLRASTVGLTCR